MLRVFVALRLPSIVRERLAFIQAGVPGARWVDPDNLHVTLRFVGEVEDHDAHEVAAELARVNAPGFDLRLAGVGHFGSARKPTLLWVGVDRCNELTLLRDRVDAAIRAAGLPPDGRKFKPHVSLARLKSDAHLPRVGRWLQDNGLFRTPPIAITEFTLFSSHLGRDGAIYTPLRDYSLETADLL